MSYTAQSKSKINHEAIQLWIDDLRSGRFNQTKQRLFRVGGSSPSGYCCLGVLCETYLSHAERAQTDQAHAQGIRHILETSYLLPPAVAEWAGLVNDTQEWYVFLDNFYVDLTADEVEELVALEVDVYDPRGVNGTPYVAASALNDIAGWDFERIAAAIERTVSVSVPA